MLRHADNVLPRHDLIVVVAPDIKDFSEIVRRNKALADFVSWTLDPDVAFLYGVDYESTRQQSARGTPVLNRGAGRERVEER
jgi:hypothetical protein